MTTGRQGVPGRLLLVLAVLAGLLVSGLTGFVAAVGGAAPAVTRAAVQAGHPAPARSAPAVRSAHRTQAAAQASTPAQVTQAGPPAAPYAALLLALAPPPAVLVVGPVLLLGQLPRPPGLPATGPARAGHPGRAPPLPTGT